MRAREDSNHARRFTAIITLAIGLCSPGLSPAPAAAPTQLDSVYALALESGEPDVLRQAILAMAEALPGATFKAELHRRIGELHIALEEADQAIEHLEATLASDSTDVQGHYLLARALQLLGNTSGARKEADVAIRHDPTFAPAYLLLAQSYEKADNTQAALTYYKHYLEQRPGSQTAAYEFTLELLKQGRHKDVEELSFRMSDVRGLPLYAQALLKNNDYEGALDIFRRYIKTRPRDIQDLYEDISRVGLKREVRAYQSTTPKTRVAFLRRFWLGKDPFKTSGGAMRRAEHYRRVWHALTFFGETKKPWDRRGDVYIRYGEPDYKSFSNLPNASVPLDVQRIQEVMAHQLYGEQGLEVSFAGPVFPIQT
ncbi:MAG: GWxTD domain-containing protein, partial [Candidatus Latescibacteria bacterium]|nr:GWxTD domain-containing protein [Candidatus Latescibacterota bacterium]